MKRRAFIQLVAAALMTPASRLMSPASAEPVVPVHPDSYFIELVLEARERAAQAQAQAFEEWLWEVPPE